MDNSLDFNSALWEDKNFNELVKQDIKKYIIDNLENNACLANMVVSCALVYLMAASNNNCNPWCAWNANARYLQDFFEEPCDDDAIRLWEATHPGHQYPSSC